MDINSIPLQFGKYKGQSLTDVFAMDYSYVEWMAQQPNMQRQHPQLFAAAMALLTGPKKTPEHNKLQARFMDPNFMRRFITTARKLNWRESELSNPGANDFANNFVSVEFESNGWDVVVSIPRCCIPNKLLALAAACRDGRDGEDQKSKWSALSAYEDAAKKFYVAVEIKPTLGDDYSAALRQIKQRWERCERMRPQHVPAPSQSLLVGAFHSVVLNRDGLRRFFAASNVEVWFVDELDALQDVIPPPPWLQT